MAGSITVPTGEVTTLEQALPRVVQWKELMKRWLVEREAAQASVAAWLNAARLAVVALDQTRACLERKEATGPALKETAAAKEQMTALIGVYTEMQRLLTNAASNVQGADGAFQRLEAELKTWLVPADGYRAAPGAADKAFLTGTGG